MAIPLYKKISHDLKEQIISKKLKEGERLPTEMELASSHNVSRITAKHALNELEQLGLITRSRGKGSFVKENLPNDRNQLSKSILFIHPFSQLSFGDFAQGLIPYMKEHDYNVFITNPDYLKERTSEDIASNFAGLVYYPASTDEYLDTLFGLLSINFPVVLLDRELYGFDFPCVKADNFCGGRLATQHLIDLGHQKIAFMMNDEVHPPHTTRDRYLGYMSALNASNLRFHTLYNKPEESSRVAIDFLKTSDVTALVCENDLIALYLMTDLQKAGFQVPKDISIVGFDNIQAALLSNPPLTTIEQNFSKMGEKAGELLWQWIKSRQTPKGSKIDVRLIERNTTKELKDED